MLTASLLFAAMLVVLSYRPLWVKLIGSVQSAEGLSGEAALAAGTPLPLMLRLAAATTRIKDKNGRRAVCKLFFIVILFS
jgi:hypothetical protein